VPAESLRRGLTHLQAAEFLYETSVFPDLEYTFKHALTHEVAYASVLHDRRRALHGRIVEAVEALYTDRLAEQALTALHPLPDTRQKIERGIDLRLDLRQSLFRARDGPAVSPGGRRAGENA
jgi:hypothetical protein